MLPVSADVRLALPTGEARPGQTDAVSPSPTAAPDVDFGDVLRSAVARVNAADHAATARVEALAAGATDDLHGTMIAVKEAEIGVRLVGAIRNKLLDAFHEIWRTGV